MRENRQSGSEGGGAKPIASPYPYNSSFHTIEVAGGSAMRISGLADPPAIKRDDIFECVSECVRFKTEDSID